MHLFNSYVAKMVVGMLTIEPGCGPLGRPKQATGGEYTARRLLIAGRKTKTSPGMEEKKNKAGEFPGV